MNRLLRRAAPLLLALLIPAAPASGLELRLPVDCQPGRDCFTQNYVDRDPGPEAADHQCGPLSYDGHKGTDIRVRQEHMRRGAPVLAAAPGVVLGVRDGMPDISVADAGRESVRGREAGNSVVVDHGDGYVTQYAHLRQGSVRVKTGDRVATGQLLGLIGLSGLTEFPHLHFETRHNGQPVCPFAGPDAPAGCAGCGAPLWDADSQSSLAYRPSMAWSAGFAAEPPSIAAALRDMANAPVLPTSSPALVFWAAFVGLRQGDRIVMRLTGPDGTTLVQNDAPIDKNQAQRVQIVGRKRAGQFWPPGRYVGTAELVRPGTADGPRIQAAVQVH